MAFAPDQLLPFLPAGKPVCHVAYSGGLDSHVLLHAITQLRDAGKFPGQLRAVHINHGLNPRAGEWADHCTTICKALDVPLEILTVAVDREQASLENAARLARMSAFETVLNDEDCLLTAHHQDDQVETMLFRILRGTGLRGLAGMRSQRPLGRGILVRPLLDFSRAELQDYAREQALAWIEDESNAANGFDRNYLRNQVMPLFEARWPGYRKPWQRLANLAAEGESLQRELGEQDLAQVRDGCHRLSIASLNGFSPLRRRNILRSWFLSLEAGFGVPSPDSRVIQQVLDEVVPAAEDAEPRVFWQKDTVQAEVRRFAGRLYIVLRDDEAELPNTQTWQVEKPLKLPANHGTLTLVESTAGGVAVPDNGRFTVAFRRGGESAKPADRKTRPLKKWLQDYQVPPWLRDTIPLIYRDDSLVAVADLFVCEAWHQGKGQAGTQKLYIIRWDRADLHCGY